MNKKCKNFEVCGQIQDHPLTKVCCAICFFRYNGKILDFIDGVECPVCLDTTRCVRFLKCPHHACVLKCFKRLKICPLCRSDPQYYEMLKYML